MKVIEDLNKLTDSAKKLIDTHTVDNKNKSVIAESYSDNTRVERE